MPNIYGFERFGYRKGLLLGIESCLRVKFGAEGQELLPEILPIWDLALLEKILHRIKTAGSPADLRRIWTRKRRPKKTDPIYGLIDEPRPPEAATPAPRRSGRRRW
jgi:hypothetical protein